MSEIKEIHPQKVKKTTCPTCRELLVKTYPWAIFSGPVQLGCGKCENKRRLSTLKSGVA